MGMGRFKNGRFDLVVVANFAMTATDVTMAQKLPEGFRAVLGRLRGATAIRPDLRLR